MKIFFLLIFPILSFSFDKDLKITSDKTPLEFDLLFDSMKLQSKTPADKIRLVGMAQELNKNLGFLPKEQIFLLMKSEVTKNFLEHKFSKVRQFDVTNLLIDRLEKNLIEKGKLLTPFSTWAFRSIIAELKTYQKEGLITDKSFNPDLFKGEKREKALRLKKYLTYLLPWIDRMDALPASDFNELSTEVGWEILDRLNSRSLLLRRYAAEGSAASGNLINIPDRLTDLKPEQIKNLQNNNSDLSLKEKSVKEKNEASEEVKSATPDDLSPLSEDVSIEIDRVNSEEMR